MQLGCGERALEALEESRSTSSQGGPACNKPLCQVGIKGVMRMSTDSNSFVAMPARGGQSAKYLLAFLRHDAPADALARAQRSSDWLERAAIARHPNTPPDVIKRLSMHGNSVVRALARAQPTGV